MVPGDVSLNHCQLFLTRVLAGKQRVLEVGCGNGQLAWRLAHLGMKVVGVDIALPKERPSHPGLKFEKADFFQYKSEPFDAVLFTTSLHHLNPLKAAIRRARNLLKRGGLVVIEELDHLAADEETARWYYEAQGLLAQAGVMKVDHHHHGRDEDKPLTRWEKEHAHAPALHPGAAMLTALRGIGELAEVSRGAFLYRRLSHWLAETPRDLNVSQWLLATEERRIKAGCMKAVGLRAVCRVD